MLIEFRVENHRSLRDEQALTFEAARLGDEADSRPRTVQGHKEKLLPVAVLYGANASGKSNVLNALAFMREAVLNSHRLWAPEGGVPREPFAWGEQKKAPSTFEVTLLFNDVKYQYGFVVDDHAILEEWLYAWPSGRKQTWFEREGEKFKFGAHLNGPNEKIREVTRPNALFLSTAAQHGHLQIIAAAYRWFARFYDADTVRSPLTPATVGFLKRELFDRASDPNPVVCDPELRSKVLGLLRAADIGIVDVKIIRDASDSDSRHGRIMLRHETGGDDSWLDLDQESDGTQTLLRLARKLSRR